MEVKGAYDKLKPGIRMKIPLPLLTIEENGASGSGELTVSSAIVANIKEVKDQ